MNFAERVTTPSKLMPVRLSQAFFRQASRTPVCPDTPRLDGKLAVVTGGNAGIGIEIVRGLAQRGAEVIIAARNKKTAQEACATIAQQTGSKLHHVPLDLTNLESVSVAAEKIRGVALGRPIDILINNAGIWPTEYAKSAQGHEIAFAVNTLGHHLLVRRLLGQGLLTEGRVVVVTGDIYIRASECTSDFTYSGKGGGALAYSRSKLGNLWFAAELQRRFPELEVHSVHPGVVASNLGGEATGFAAKMRDAMMLDVKGGAQTPLFCATQPNLTHGGYYHNTCGLMKLPPGDPAADTQKAAAMWDRLEALSAQYR